MENSTVCESNGNENENDKDKEEEGAYYDGGRTTTAAAAQIDVNKCSDSDNNYLRRRPPRIGILNRMGSRTILNWKELANQLSKIVYIYNNTTTDKNENNSSNITNTTNDENVNVNVNRNVNRNVNNTVHVTFFENKTFEEQVQFFRNTDILISPHGAQLTGLMFMSSSSSSTSSSNSKSCKQVMELFPKNYAIPYYFGSLAIQSGISHSYVYYDDGIKKINTTASDEVTTNATRTTNTIATILSSISRFGARTKNKTSDSNNQADEKE